MALKAAHEGACWNVWPAAIARRNSVTLSKWRERLDIEVQFHCFLQFMFMRQWQALKHYANERGIRLIGDIPFYVAHDSADVWALPQNFCLDADSGNPVLMAGVPPDYFSATGQLWGNPVFNWDYLREAGFQWWIDRFKGLLEMVDYIRVDHFRGFQAFWAVPQGETTAMNGQWIGAPGHELFETLQDKLGQLPVLAEDLGLITPDVFELRDRFELPGMKILQFAFDSGDDNPYLPWNYHTDNCLVYTGTHDNDTTVGWFEQRSPEQRQRVYDCMGGGSADGIHWDLIHFALNSRANAALIPLQDVLGLGSEHRMNTPGRANHNWAWRYQAEDLTPEMGDRLRQLTANSGRSQ
jgi:4-alpha-glucanotransferase